MRYHHTFVAVVNPAQSIAVSRTYCTNTSTRVTEVRVQPIESPGMMHFSYGAALYRSLLLQGRWWPGANMKGNIVAKLFYGGDHTPHGAPATIWRIVQKLLFFPVLVDPSVTMRQFVGGNIAIFPGGCIHLQRP